MARKALQACPKPPLLLASSNRQPTSANRTNPFSLSHFFCPSKSKSKTEEENWHPINHSLEIRGGGGRIGEHTIVGEDAEEEEVKDKGERGFHLRKQLRGSLP